MQFKIFPDQRVQLELMVDSGPRQLSGLVKSVEGPVAFILVEGLAPHDVDKLDSSEIRVWLSNTNGLYSIPGNYEIMTGHFPHLVLRVHLFSARTKKIQRRDYFRLRTKEVIKYLPEISWEDTDVKGWRETRTIDLSGNGLSFRAPEPLAHGTHVQLQLFLPKSPQTIIIGARVVSAVKMNRSNAHKVVVQFVEISERERWQIIGYLNALQRSKCGYQ